MKKNAFKNRLGTPRKDSGLQRPGYTIWGSSVIRGEDGKYHMFASSWIAGHPLSSWATNSTIVHAVSETPEGPFHYLAEALPPRGEGHWDGSMTHNPTIHRHEDTFILFYTGSFHTCSGDFDRNMYEALAHKRIGIATSKSVYGPWTRYDEPILQPRENKWDAFITSNPAPCIEPDGGVLLIYKSWTVHAQDPCRSQGRYKVNQLLGVARADHYLGQYRRVREERLFHDSPLPFNSEDPYVWRQDGRYHMLAKIFGAGAEMIGEANAGYYATSDDGVEWTIDRSGAAYSRTVTWEDGSSDTFERVERAQVLVEEGKPTHVYFACLSKDPKVESRSICVPIDQAGP